MLFLYVDFIDSLHYRTLVHDLHLFDEINLSFKQICNRRAVVVQHWKEDYIDVRVGDADYKRTRKTDIDIVKGRVQ